jgi:hypothetical protein
MNTSALQSLLICLAALVLLGVPALAEEPTADRDQQRLAPGPSYETPPDTIHIGREPGTGDLIIEVRPRPRGYHEDRRDYDYFQGPVEVYPIITPNTNPQGPN